MKLKSVINNKIKATIGIFILTSIFILWEYFNGGVVSHNLLARKDLPAISNWWGLLTVPLLFWIAISLVNRRRGNEIKSELKSEEYETKVLKRFLAAFAFGIIISLLWEFNFGNFLQYFILFPILIAFFTPVHLPECLMGFVLGMLFTFGGVLPILIGVILLIICFLMNKLMKILRNLISPKTNRTKYR
ncbi:MAG TPA: hypothetical protein VLZ83_02595 [Edaphocola sp.]|nr:hypothetical protein [Edaphocola sp.]